MLNTFCSNTFVSSFSCDFPSLDGGYELDAIQFYKSPKFWDTFQLLVKCYATEDWHAVIWIVWKVRNDMIFNNKVSGVDEMVEQVKVIAWH
jgi:hypothetical protein